MKCLILANAIDQKGLARDAAILSRTLAALGHEPSVIDWRDHGEIDAARGRFDAVFVFEVLEPDQRRALAPGGKLFYVPNPEWDVPAKALVLPQVDRVLCKTMDAANVGPWDGKARFLGFESDDLGEPAFAEPLEYFHAAGSSITRGTAAVLRAWSCAITIGLPPGAKLVISQPPPNGEVRELLVTTPRIEVYPERLADHRFNELRRRAAVHIVGSEYEGWGHLFWEALSLGAHVIGTDGPWWDEARGAFAPVKATRTGKRCLATQLAIDSRALASAMVEAAHARIESATARACFERARDGFRARFAAFMEEEFVGVTR